MNEFKSGLAAVHAAFVGDHKTGDQAAAVAQPIQERIAAVRAVVARSAVQRALDVARAANKAPPPANNSADAWRIEFEQSPALQAEFLKVEIYQAFRQGEMMGRVSRHQGRVQQVSKPD